MSNFDGHDWPYVSASQFKTYSMCNRKWHIERFSGMERTPPTDSMLLGTEVHEILEDHLRGIPDSQWRDNKAARLATAVANSPYCPKPLTAIVEGEINIDYAGMAPPLKGFIDVLIPPYKTDDGIPTVLDWKTTSDFKWAKTDEELKTDLQMIPYAAYALETFKTDKIRVSHVQIRTKGAPAVRKSTAVLSLSRVAGEWRGLVQLAKKMRATADIEKAQDVPCNTNACGAYGGCPFRDLCGIIDKTNNNPFANMQAIPTKTKESKVSRLQELLAKKKAAKNKTTALSIASAGVVPPDAPAVTVDIAPPAPVAKTADRFGAYEYSQVANAFIIHMETSGATSLDKPEAVRIAGEILGLKRVMQKYVKAACRSRGEFLSYDESDRSVRYLKSTEEVPPLDEQLAAVDPPEAPAEPVILEENVPSELPTAPVCTSKILYIDCFPVKGTESVLFSDIVAPLVKQVAEANGMPIPLLMDYGKGKAEVAALLSINLPTGSVAVITKDPYWESCSTVLMANADTIIKGMF